MKLAGWMVVGASALVLASSVFAQNGGKRQGNAARANGGERAVKRDRAQRQEQKANRQAQKANRQEKKNKAEKKAHEQVEQRQANQEKRIQQGIGKGCLTAEETAALKAQQKRLADLQAALAGDGNLTPDEAQQLREVLNDASRFIWAEKHNTQGNQMPVYRFGVNVRARQDFADVLATGNLTKAEACTYLKDFLRVMELEQLLAGGDLNAEERARMQDEYDILLNKYFVVVS